MIDFIFLSAKITVGSDNCSHEIKTLKSKGLMLKLKRQYFGHLMRRINTLEKTLMLGKIEGRRRGDNRG